MNTTLDTTNAQPTPAETIDTQSGPVEVGAAEVEALLAQWRQHGRPFAGLTSGDDRTDAEAIVAVRRQAALARHAALHTPTNPDDGEVL